MKIQLKIVSLVLVSNLLIEQKSTCAATVRQSWESFMIAKNAEVKEMAKKRAKDATAQIKAATAQIKEATAQIKAATAELEATKDFATINALAATKDFAAIKAATAELVANKDFAGIKAATEKLVAATERVVNQAEKRGDTATRNALFDAEVMEEKALYKEWRAKNEA